MKKIIASLFLLLTLAAFETAFATTVEFTPASTVVNTNEIFYVPIMINPEAEKIYTAKIEITFDPNILEVLSFTPHASAIALTQPGFDDIDNIRGIIVKTLGFPVGMDSPTMFGSIIFRSKRAGQSQINLTNNYELINASNNHVIVREAAAPITIAVSPLLPQAGIISITPSKTPSQTQASKTTAPKISQAPKESSKTTKAIATATSTATTTPGATTSPLEARVEGANINKAIWWIIGILALIGIVAAAVSAARKTP